MKGNKGITLIALVITIIIMLILAGVTINLALGENGLIGYARNAKAETEQKKEQEQQEMNNAVDLINSLAYGKSQEDVGEGEIETTIKLAEVAKIGDYVNYDPTKIDANKTQTVEENKLRYTSPKGTGMSHGNGSSEQTITVPANTAWRVLSVDNDTGIVELISADVLQLGLSLYGAVGYLYAEQELNEACKIFGYGYGADTTLTTSYTVGGPLDTPVVGTITGSGARCVNMGDINKLLGVAEEEFPKYKGTNLLPYGDCSGPWNYTYSPTTATANGKSFSGNLIRTKCTAYQYSSEFISSKGVGSLVLSSTKYFISSRCVATNEGWYGAGTFVGGDSVTWSTPFGADGGGSCDQWTNSRGVRPVVRLTSNVEIKTNDTTKDGTSEEKAFVLN